MLPIYADYVRLDLVRIFGVAHIGDGDRGLADSFEGKGVDALHVMELAIRVDVVVIRTNFRVTRGKNQICVVHRAYHIHWTQLVGLQFCWVYIHHDLAVLTAERRRHGSPGHASKLVANLKLAEVPELRFA